MASPPRPSALLVPLLTLAACSPPAVTGVEELGAVTQNQVVQSGPLTYVIDTSPVVGGISSLKWREPSREWLVGGGFYIIASCTGYDDKKTNVDSRNAVWSPSLGKYVLGNTSGTAASCSPPFTMSISGANPIRATITVGPLPAYLGALAISADIHPNLVQYYAFKQGTSHVQGCADNWQSFPGTTGAIDNIRKPCALPYNEGYVGLASQNYLSSGGVEVSGPVGRILMYADTSIPVKERGVTDHPHSHALGFAAYQLAAGTYFTADVRLTVDDQVFTGEVPKGAWLAPYSFVEDTNGGVRFIHQNDGNVVVYRKSTWTPLWSTGTAGRATQGLYFQSDGNLVLYDIYGRAIWQSGTASSGARLRVQTDGNVVIYNASGQPVWATNTFL